MCVRARHGTVAAVASAEPADVRCAVCDVPMGPIVWTVAISYIYIYNRIERIVVGLHRRSARSARSALAPTASNSINALCFFG